MSDVLRTDADMFHSYVRAMDFRGAYAIAKRHEADFGQLGGMIRADDALNLYAGLKFQGMDSKAGTFADLMHNSESHLTRDVLEDLYRKAVIEHEG